MSRIYNSFNILENLQTLCIPLFPLILNDHQTNQKIRFQKIWQNISMKMIFIMK